MTNNVFITGGSRGIGAAAVLAFARAGYNVAFTYNSHPDAADAVRRQVEGINPGGLYLAIRADAGDPAQGARRRCPGRAGTRQSAGARLQCGHRAGQAVHRHHRRGLAADDGCRSGRRVLRLPRGAARYDPPQIRPHPAVSSMWARPRQLRGRLQRGQGRAHRPWQGPCQGGRPPAASRSTSLRPVSSTPT